MDLFERYLSAVASQLPARQREDVVAELRDLLLSMREEREAALGRPLSDAEIEALLREVGHPLVVAARYRRVQHLIGPEVFPFYLFALKAVLLFVLVIQIIVAGIGAAVAPEGLRQLAGWPGSLIGGLVGAFAWVTLAAVVVEQLGLGKKLAGAWRVRDLPAAAPPRRHCNRRFELACEVGFGVVFLLWWTGVIHFKPLVFGQLGHPPALDVEMSAAWAPFWWPILIYSAARVGLSLVELVRPAWARIAAGGQAAALAGGAVIAGMLNRAGALFTFSGPGVPTEEMAKLVGAVDLGVRIFLVFLVVVLLAQAAAQLWRAVRPRGAGCLAFA